MATKIKVIVVQTITALLLASISAASSAVPFFWADWTGSDLDPGAGFRAEGYTETPGAGGISNLLANIKKYMMFVIVMGLVSGIITAVVGMFLPPAGATGTRAYVWLAVAVVPIVSFVGSFLGAIIIWALVDGLLSGKMSEYGLSYKLIAVLAAFSPISAIVAPIPAVGQYLAIALNVWATIVMIIGIIAVRKTSVVRTWVVCGVLFAFLFLLDVFARIAAQRQFAGPGGGVPEFGETTGANDKPTAAPTPM